MKIKTISTLAFSLLMLSACSSKKETLEPQATLPIENIIVENNIIDNSIVENSVIINENIITENNPIIFEPIQITNTQSYTGLYGDFENNHKLQNFIQRMVSTHGFDEGSLTQLFSEAKNTRYMPTIIRERRRRTQSSAPTGKWDRYRNMFIYERNIDRGIAFWAEHENTLNRAYETYGVLPEYIMGIIGIETAYGVGYRWSGQ